MVVLCSMFRCPQWLHHLDQHCKEVSVSPHRWHLLFIFKTGREGERVTRVCFSTTRSIHWLFPDQGLNSQPWGTGMMLWTARLGPVFFSFYVSIFTQGHAFFTHRILQWEEGGEKQWSVASHTPWWKTEPRPGHVPRQGIEPWPFWVMGQHSTTEPYSPGCFHFLITAVLKGVK